MPIGIIINSLSIIVGGLLGAVFSQRLNKEFCGQITLIFGICSMTMGLCSIMKLEDLPPVVLAVIVGTILGEVLQIEKRIVSLTRKVQVPLKRLLKRGGSENEEAFMVNFISILVLFCASGTGIFGSLQSGITDDHTILITKSILDLFTAAIFAAGLGYIVMLVAIPQCAIFLLLFYGSGFIMPFVTPTLLNDFTACGGIMMLAAGFRIAGIKEFPIANMIPSMALVMFFSALWIQIVK